MAKKFQKNSKKPFSIKPSDISSDKTEPQVEESSAAFTLTSTSGKKTTSLKSGLFAQKIKEKDKLTFTRELSVLMDAGVPIVGSLNILAKQIKNERLRGIVEDISDSIEGGSSFSSALEKYPNVFSHLYISLVKSGEVSGTLDDALSYIAEQQEKDYTLKRNIIEALTYPVIIIVAMIGILALLFTFVMPKMLVILEETSVELPITTKALIFTTNIFSNYWWIIFLLIALAFASLKYATTKPAGKLWWDKTKLRFPIWSGIAKKIYLERFARNFAVLVKGGIPIVKSLKISSEIVGNDYYRKLFLDAAQSVDSGRTLTQSISGHPDYIPDLMVQMIEVGEQTSKVDAILLKVASFYEDESQRSVKTLTQLLEPVVMIVLGGIVAMIVSGILLPIYNLVNIQ